MEYPFTKMHGIGNDFVVFDTFSSPLEPSREQLRHIADRHYGIGCDQILLLQPPESAAADVRYRIFNADGAEVMQCGNGARCAAVYLKQNKLLDKDRIIAETGAGRLLLQLNKDGSVTVNMGVPEFEPAHIPLKQARRSGLYRINLSRQVIEFGALALGNPHAVIKVDDVDKADVQGIGAELQQQGIFPEGVNAGFIEILNRQSFKLRVYERGSGETLACGSGACAAMVIACQQGYLEETIDAELRGGHLGLSWAGENEPVYMSGSATTVYRGKWTL